MTLEDPKLLISVRTCATSANLGPGYDIAGPLIANKVYNLNLSLKELFNIGVEIETHPDNIAACLAGG